LLALTAAACVHPPRSEFPAIIGGAVHAPTQGPAASGAPIDDAPPGPLRLSDGTIVKEQGGLRWQVVVHNPTSSPFGVTLVLTVVDADGQLRESDNVSFRIGSGETREVSRVAPAPGPAPPAHAGSWQIESWVRVLEAPDRRTLRGTG